MTDAVLPAAVGLLIGAVGSVVFFLRKETSEDDQTGRVPSEDQRRLALRNVLVPYAVVTWTCLVVALVFGDTVFIVLAAVSTLLATVGLVRLWPPRSPRSRRHGTVS